MKATRDLIGGGLEIIGATKKQAIVLTNDNDTRRRFFEKCEVRAKSVCNPIIEWTNTDIWDFICAEKIETNPLYQCGFDRVGCIGCPLANKKRYFEFMVYPKYKNLYIRAFDRMIQERLSRGLKTQWKTGEEVFTWWMGEDINQITISDYLKEVSNVNQKSG